MTIPRLVIAAPASGSGKTTVATGLMAAFRRRGLTVSPHKVGPDYIDPGYHALATGRPGRNLDPFLTSETLVAPLLLHGARGADVAVIEGVMGMYDGAAPDGRGGNHGGGGDLASTAHVAALLEAPVVLVVDASAAGRSVAAIVHGFRTYAGAGGAPGRADRSVARIGGVILNRLGSDRHEEICRDAVEGLGLPVLGALRHQEDVVTPARHLGLIPAAERREEAVRAIEGLAELVAGSCDLDALMALARTAPELTVTPWDPALAEPRERYGAGGARPVRVAIAAGRAFTFGYAENAELLAAAGAEIVPFDPLRERDLPEGTDALVIGGGFPEMHAAELAANVPLRARVAALDPATPIYAECAGLLYLARELDGVPMAGLLDAVATMTPRLTLGYRAAVAVSDSVVARAGQRVHGHEFHRTSLTPARGAVPAWQWSRSGAEGFVQNGVLASYLHLHWAGAPGMAARFVSAAARASGAPPSSPARSPSGRLGPSPGPTR